MKYYTIFLGDKPWENVIDDMNTTSIWAIGGMMWDSVEKAESCMYNLKEYDFEDDQNKFSIREVSFNPPLKLI